MRSPLLLLILTGCASSYEPPPRYLATNAREAAALRCGDRIEAATRKCFRYATSDDARDACMELHEFHMGRCDRATVAGR